MFVEGVVGAGDDDFFHEAFVGEQCAFVLVAVLDGNSIVFRAVDEQDRAARFDDFAQGFHLRELPDETDADEVAVVVGDAGLRERGDGFGGGEAVENAGAFSDRRPERERFETAAMPANEERGDGAAETHADEGEPARVDAPVGSEKAQGFDGVDNFGAEGHFFEVTGTVAGAAVIEAETRDAVFGERASEFDENPVGFGFVAGEAVEQQCRRHAAAAVGDVEHADDLLAFRLEDDRSFHERSW